MSFRGSLFAAVALSLGIASAAVVDGFTAGTVYVDPRNPTTGDGSKTNPYSTVAAAVAAAPAGAKIVLAAGTYDSEAVSTTLDGVDSVSRIVLTKKLYLLGAGRDRTFIVGADATSPDVDGLGTGAVRGILATTEAAGSLVEGLTIQGGRTVACDVNNTTTDTSAPNIRERYTASTNKLAYTGANYAACGGGLYFTGTSRMSADLMTMVDCSVEDCRAGYAGAAVYGNVRLVRCYVARSYAPTFQGGVIARVPVAFSSIFAGNGKVLKDCGDSIHAAPASYSSSYRETVCVNCTFNGNFGGGLPHTKNGKDIYYWNGSRFLTYNDTDSVQRFEFYNTIFWVHGAGLRHVTGSVECYNCCQNAYGSLKNAQANVLDGNGQLIPRQDSSTKYYMTNTIGNVGSDYYPRLSQDAVGTTTADSPCHANSGAKDYVPAITNGYAQFADGYGRYVHLREGSILINHGETKWLTAGANTYSTALIGLIPAEYLDKDFYGNARVQDGQIDQGAAEGGYEKGTAYTIAGVGSYQLYINGCPYNNDYFKGLAISGVPGWEMEIGFNLSADKELYALVPSTLKVHNKNNYASLRYAFPNFRAKSVKVRVESAARYASETYTVYVAPTVKWVDPVNGLDTNAGTEAAPYKTLQKAVNESSGNGVVLAKPGVYAEGGVNDCSSVCDSDWYLGTGSRVKITKNLRLVGAEGAEKTVIMGSATTATPEQIASGEEFVNTGCGTGAKRCVGIQKGYFVQVQGFTLTGGHVESDPIGKNYRYQVAKGKTIKTPDTAGCFNFSGGAVCAGTSDYNSGYNCGYIDDCIISNNVAYIASALTACFARRCVITANRNIDVSLETNCVISGATQKYRQNWYVCNFSSLSHCLVYSNDCASSELCSGRDYNSFYNNLVWEPGKVPFRSGAIYNNIIYNSNVYNYSGLGNICWPAAANWTNAHATDDPLVGVGDAGCPMVATGSPALRAGVADTTASDTFGYVHSGPGIDGYALPYGGSSTMPAGPYFGTYAFAAVGAHAGENRAVAGASGIEPVTSAFYAHPWDAAAAQPVVFTATDPRQLAGFKVNGVLVPAPSRTYTWDPTTDGGLSISPVYALTQDWFVDAAKSDANDGFTAETAKQTLNGALAYAKSGDTVYVAEGVYDSNFGRLDPARINAAVAVVPSGVTLQATGSRDATIIKGKWGTHYKNVNYQNLDLGDDAVRCLEMGSNTCVKGFTLYNGGTCNSTRDDEKTYVVETDRAGAGAIATAPARFEDCFFTNLSSTVYAACNVGVTYMRCQFIRCGTSGNHVTTSSEHYNCYIDWSFDTLFFRPKVVKNCTIGPNNRIGFTQGAFPNRPFAEMPQDGVIENTLCLLPPNKTDTLTNRLYNVRNCLFNVALTNRLATTEWGDSNRFCTIAEAMLDANGHLLAGSPAIDTGDNTLLVAGKSDGLDLAGGQRIYNGTVDVGAYEYDWRADYAAQLGQRRIQVTAATPNVTLIDDELKLVDGSTLSLNWPGRGVPYVATYTLSGEGTLTIKDENGATVKTVTAAGTDSYEIASPDANTALTFAYTGSGNVVMQKFRCNTGLIFLVR